VELVMNEVIQLSGRQRSLLVSLLKNQCDSRQYQRALGLLLLDEGDSAQEVAQSLHVSRRTVYNWAKRFEQREALPAALRLLDGPRGGRPPTAQGIIDPLIEAVIDEDPRDHGCNSTVWTAALLRLYLWEEHHRAAGRRSIGRAMARLRLRWKHPRHELTRRAPFWRQAKGGSKRASGPIPARSL
jgi:transposase